MQRALVTTLGLLTVGLMVVHAAPQAAAGWTLLFDGKNLNAFNIIGDANWQLADGVVQANQGNGYLVTKNTYGDYQLKVEFWVDDEANSGVFIRCEDPKQITAMNAYEVNIYDKRPDQAYRTGAIVDVAKPLANINAGGKWNTFEITAQKSHFVVILNGTKTVDVENSAHARGVIALQYGGGNVKFRNVQIKPL